MMELIEQESNHNPIPANSLELFWREHIQLKKESGLSGAAYCREHALMCHQLYYWESRLKPQRESELPFIAVKLDSRSVPFVSSQPPEVLCSLELKNGQQLKVHDVAVLPLLISLLS